MEDDDDLPSLWITNGANTTYSVLCLLNGHERAGTWDELSVSDLWQYRRPKDCAQSTDGFTFSVGSFIVTVLWVQNQSRIIWASSVPVYNVATSGMHGDITGHAIAPRNVTGHGSGMWSRKILQSRASARHKRSNHISTSLFCLLFLL